MVKESLSDRLKPFIAMMMVDLGFAVGNILMKIALDEGLNNLVLITYRLVISTLFLAPIGYFSERNNRPKLTLRIFCCLNLSAMLGAVLLQYCFLFGMGRTSATFACAFFNIVPVMTFLIALPLGLETVDMRSSTGRAKVTGAVLCTVGAVTLMLYKGKLLFNRAQSSSQLTKSRTTTAVEWLISSAVLMLGSLAYAGWFILQSYVGKLYPCKYTSTALMSFFGGIQSAVMVVILSLGKDNSMWVLKGKLEIIAIVYAGVVNAGLCFALMSWCVKRRGSVFTSAFTPFTLIMAAVIDVPLLHSQFYLGSLLGSIAVISGLYVLLWGKDREKQMQGKCPGARQGRDTNTEVVEASSVLPRPAKVDSV